jgi:uncharacterized protein involved in high-affinity Fe2+ transport
MSVVPGGKKELEELKTSCQIDLMSFSNSDAPHPGFPRALNIARLGEYSITFAVKRPRKGMWKK